MRHLLLTLLLLAPLAACGGGGSAGGAPGDVTGSWLLFLTDGGQTFTSSGALPAWFVLGP